MVFSSVFFIAIFSPIVLIGYLIFPQKLRNVWLLIASFYFYYIGSSKFILLLLGVITICYISAIVIQLLNGSGKKIGLFVSISLLVLILSYYKYTNFVIDNLHNFLSINLKSAEIVLPLGISFFVFQGISYIVDVYRGKSPMLNPFNMALYISNFPQLVAGPIVKYSDVSKQMASECRICKADNIAEGVWRFSIGLSKKVLLANNMGGCCDLIFGSEYVANYSVCYSWLGAILYTLQIYYDFSGYSDMAIGLGKCFGFDYLENFNYPYEAKSFTDFWRRWHISLSSWFRDYVYIPLGGNKVPFCRWLFNLFVVWGLTGLWHGASWNYIIWGLFYFVLLTIEKIFVKPESRSNAFKAFYRIAALVAIVLLWVIFRTDNMERAVEYMGSMFGVFGNKFIDMPVVFQIRNIGLILLIGIVGCTSIPKAVFKRIPTSRVKSIGSIIALLALVSISFGYILTGGYNPFLYFIF